MSEAQYFKRLSFQKEQNILEAIARFRDWLNELLKQGLSDLQHDPAKLDEIATRMVDSGLQGIARKLRLLPERIAQREDWMDFIIFQIGEFYQLVKLFDRLHELQDLEKEDLLNFCGIPFPKTGFDGIDYFTDEWLFLGTVSEKEEKLLVHRNWFYGLNCKNVSLFLEYQFNRFVPTKIFKAGSLYKSAVQFFPSAVPQRIRDIQSDKPSNINEYFVSANPIESALDIYANQVLSNSLLRHSCFIINPIELFSFKSSWFLIGKSGQMIKLSNSKSEIQSIVAYSSNTQNIFIGEFAFNEIKLFSVILDGQLILINN